MSKLRSTYLKALPALIGEDGRVHTTFNQATTATGRLSSSNPNLQNIPIRGLGGKLVRKAFVAEEGFKLLSADYGQIELRILASMSRDQALCEAFREGRDVHVSSARLMFGLTTEGDVTTEMRRKAKEVNYAIPYGISAFGLSKSLKIPVSEAQFLIEQHQASHPGVWDLIDRLKQECLENGYASTLLGRKRYVPRMASTRHMERAQGGRVAVNMPIQGSQADMIKVAMLRIAERIHSEDLCAHMILQVHDELLFEVHEDVVDKLKELVRHEMVNALPLEGVPVEVSIGIGRTWLEAH